MGKRKKSSRKPQGPKRSDPLPSTFTCLFCNHEDSVSVKLDKKAGVGHLDCKVCGQKFQCAVNYLSAAVDVYGEWVDAADAVAKEGNPTSTIGGQGRTSSSRRGIASRPAGDGDEDEEEEAEDHRTYEGEDIAADDEEY